MQFEQPSFQHRGWTRLREETPFELTLALEYSTCLTKSHDLRSCWKTLNENLISTGVNIHTRETIQKKMQDALSFTVKEFYSLEEMLDSSQKMEKAVECIIDFYKNLSNLVLNPSSHSSIEKLCNQTITGLKIWIDLFNRIFNQSIGRMNGCITLHLSIALGGPGIDRKTVEHFHQLCKNLEPFCLNDLKTPERISCFSEVIGNLKKEINKFRGSLRNKTSASGQMCIIIENQTVERYCSESIRILDEWNWMIDPIIEKLRLEAREPIENPLTVEAKVLEKLGSVETRLLEELEKFQTSVLQKLASIENRLAVLEEKTAKEYRPSSTLVPPEHEKPPSTPRSVNKP